jgi:hypothetical protein
MSNDNIDPSKGQFIDPMFAVVIAAAVAETIVVWVKGNSVPSFFQVCIVTLGYVNLLLSWFGYHKSIAKAPIKGSLRFITTVALLPLYLLSIILFEKDFISIAIVYSLVFFLWSCWEYFKYIEYGDRKSFLSLQLKSFNLIVYVATAYLYCVNYLPISFQHYWVVINAEGLTLISIAIAVIALRIIKSAGEGSTAISRIIAEIKSLLFGKKDSSTT